MSVGRQLSRSDFPGGTHKEERNTMNIFQLAERYSGIGEAMRGFAGPGDSRQGFLFLGETKCYMT